MIYQVRVLSPKGKLRKIVSSKKLTKKSLDEALSMGQFTTFPGYRSQGLLKKWREFMNILEAIPAGRSRR